VIALLMAGAVSILVSLVGTPLLIRWLQAHGIGQPILEELAHAHVVKTGTPTMGGLTIALGQLMNVHLLLPIISGLFVLIWLSNLIQIFSFRVFHRRVFKMAPLQHHFELIGWPETTIVVRFWILAGLCTAMALGVFYADFIALGVLD
jgi:UDP-N-acetylmuramyl pentapeptide phosphotransferase/UDP-N-acetylglucosamine-1-phosphate transferase